ncbi:MAG: anthranilate phosphoribosyltransferase [Thermoplasmata archaeon]|nr:anthranilate phosphoribosyltransferase [Thermoplasmata archaeon]
MIASLLGRLLQARPLSAAETRTTFDSLLSSRTSDLERTAVLVALAARPTTAPELTQFVREFERRAVPFRVPSGDHPIDLCGSGGARTPSFNVSTVSAFVVAAAGAPVVKHGNRSARGPCGSSDLLEALGLPVVESIPFARATYRKMRLAFLHAPLFHPATRAAGAARRALGIPTVFNQLGPLSNPAHVPFQVVGVADLPTAVRTAEVMKRLGRRRAMAVTSAEGCDEFSPKRETEAVVLSDGRLTRRTIFAKDLLPPEDRRGSWGPLPPDDAAEEARRILAGGGGARRGSVLLTAGAALWVAGAVRRLSEGVERSRAALDSGDAETILARMTDVAARFRRLRGA